MQAVIIYTDCLVGGCEEGLLSRNNLPCDREGRGGQLVKDCLSLSFLRILLLLPRGRLPLQVRYDPSEYKVHVCADCLW